MKIVVLETLSSPGCHNCTVFKEFWNGIRNNWQNVQLKEMSIITSEGLTMVEKHKIFSSPGIVLNGELFSTGVVDTDRFVQKLTELSQ